MHYLRNVFPIVLPILDFRLQEAWKQANFDPKLIEDVDKLPRMAFGDWVGGDRDGHPFVTSEVTEFTLNTLRSNAVELIREHLTDLVIKLSLSTTRQNAPNELIDYVHATAKALGKKGMIALERNPDEYWRQLLNLMLIKLPNTENETVKNRLYGMVLEELQRARKMVELIYGHPLETRRPKTVSLLKLRQRKLRTLHFYQIELIQKWRGLKAEDKHEEANKMLPELLLSVNAIAGGLRTTG